MSLSPMDAYEMLIAAEIKIGKLQGEIERLREGWNEAVQLAKSGVKARECQSKEIDRLIIDNEQLRQDDKEAATYVESVICMRTNFTGEPPYVGWKGLGLALNEALDERERLRAALTRLMTQPTEHPLRMTPEERKELWAAHEEARRALEPKP